MNGTEAGSAVHDNIDKIAIIGIGEYRIGKGKMSTIGLGSCVALILHDTDHNIGALAHVMLPCSNGRSNRPAMYADTVIDLLISDLRRSGSRESAIISKLVGGASMFRTLSTTLNVGEKNIEILTAGLRDRQLPIRGREIGGDIGRTVLYDPTEGGKVWIKTANGPPREI